jgi:hypothetical protein
MDLDFPETAEDIFCNRWQMLLHAYYHGPIQNIFSLI